MTAALHRLCNRGHFMLFLENHITRKVALSHSTKGGERNRKMTETKGKYYITTPIYYPSDNLHIGHTYCTVMADAMARFKRALGYDGFLTGTDEHTEDPDGGGEGGSQRQAYVTNQASGVKDLWKTMEISYDDFIRTTEPRHVKRVQEIFMKMYEKGDIYPGKYEGLYCTPCETFLTQRASWWTASAPTVADLWRMRRKMSLFLPHEQHRDDLLKLSG